MALWVSDRYSYTYIIFGLIGYTKKYTMDPMVAAFAGRRSDAVDA